MSPSLINFLYILIFYLLLYSLTFFLTWPFTIHKYNLPSLLLIIHCNLTCTMTRWTTRNTKDTRVVPVYQYPANAMFSTWTYMNYSCLQCHIYISNMGLHGSFLSPKPYIWYGLTWLISVLSCPVNPNILTFLRFKRGFLMLFLCHFAFNSTLNIQIK